MKKYVKPELFHEYFELTQHIADCAWELTNSTMETCSAQADPKLLPGFPNLFMYSANGCMITDYQDICYHGGTQGANVFAS